MGVMGDKMTRTFWVYEDNQGDFGYVDLRFYKGRENLKAGFIHKGYALSEEQAQRMCDDLPFVE